MIARIQIRRDTASNWTANNPILTLGEIGYDTDTEKFKVGISSSSRWNDLPYELGQWRSDASGNISYGYASDGPAEGNVSINNDLFVGGDLTVKGTTTTINTEVATFKDDIIQLNLDIDDTGIYSGSLQSGFEVNRGDVPSVGPSTQKLYWDETSLKWVIDTDLNVLGDIYSNGVALWRLNGNDIYFDNGYVGIGLDNPSSVLHIKDVAPIITLEDENNPAHIWNVGQNADTFFINTETADDGSMFSMLEGGNVGIGTDSPATLLHLKDITPENEDVCLRLENDDQVWDLCNRGSDSDKFKLFDVTGNKAPFIVETASSADSLYIRSNGSVGINTSSPLLNTWANRALTIKADVGTTSVATLELDGCVTSATDQIIGAITFHNQAVASGSRRVAQITATTNDPYDAEAGNLDFYTSGTNGNILHRMRVASNGNVGIGTDLPSSPLHVVGSKSGDRLIALNLTNNQITDNTQTAIRFSNSSDVDLLSAELASERQSDESNDFWLKLREDDSKTNQVLTVKGATGNVGIGTTDPSAKLDVVGEINFSGTAGSFVSSLSQPRIYRSGSDQGTYPFDNYGHLILQSRTDGSNRDIVFATGTDGANLTVIDSDGKVGIGTTGPSSKLHINGSSGVFAKITDSASTGTVETGLILERSAANTDYRVLNDGTFRVQTATDASTWTDIMTITAAGHVDFLGDVTSGGVQVGVWTPNANDIYYNTGNVGIGTTDPDELLHVADTSANSNPGIRIENDDQEWVIYNRGSTSDRFQIFDVDNNVTPFRILPNSPTNSISINSTGIAMGKESASEKLDVVGNITATGTITSASDIALKENIELISDPIEKVKELSGYTFNKKGEDLRLVGLIAQEVEKVLPEAVAENQEGLKSVAYGNLVALLVECVKKQDERIESLEKTIKEMK